MATEGTHLYGDRAPHNEEFVVLTASSNLTQERVLTGTANQIVITDNGAGSTVVLSTPQDIHTAATPQFTGLGIGIAAGEGTVHIHTATAGAVTAPPGGDDLIVENSDFCGITILSPSNKAGTLYFGCPADNDAGQFQYFHVDHASGPRFDISVGGIKYFSITPAEFIVNDDSLDHDFRAESNSNTHMLFVDAANDKVGIGITPNQPLTIEGTMSMKEQATANADTASYLQLWVKSDAPNILMVTDDAGTDFTIDVTAV